MNKSLIRKNQLHPDIADLVSGYGSQFFVSTGSLNTILSSQNIAYTTGNQNISGVKNFVSRPTVNGTGILLSGEATNGGVITNVVYTTGNQIVSGIKTFTNSGVFNRGIDLQNSSIINSVPEFLTRTSNFNISGNDNSRIILANASTQITGTIVNNNPTGFNVSIIQGGNGQVRITGSVGVILNEFGNQYKTAGIYGIISLLHTGNNSYIMYGNTAL